MEKVGEKCYKIKKHVVSFQYGQYCKLSDHIRVFFTGQYEGREPNDVAAAAATPEQPRPKCFAGSQNQALFSHYWPEKGVATHVRHLLRTMLEQLHMHDNHFHCFVLSQLPISLCRSIGDT